MKRKLLTALCICSALMAAPVCTSWEKVEADEMETEQAGIDMVMPDNIETLWQMYLDLLADYNSLKEKYEALIAEDETNEADQYIFECKNGTLEYDHCGFLPENKFKTPTLCLFFNYVNNGSETSSAKSTFKIKVFQGGIEQSGVTVLFSGIKEINNQSKDVRPGSGLTVAYTFYADPDGGDVEVDVSENVWGDSDTKTFVIDITDAEILK